MLTDSNRSLQGSNSNSSNNNHGGRTKSKQKSALGRFLKLNSASSAAGNTSSSSFDVLFGTNGSTSRRGGVDASLHTCNSNRSIETTHSAQSAPTVLLPTMTSRRRSTGTSSSSISSNTPLKKQQRHQKVISQFLEQDATRLHRKRSSTSTSTSTSNASSSSNNSVTSSTSSHSSMSLLFSHTNNNNHRNGSSSSSSSRRRRSKRSSVHLQVKRFWGDTSSSSSSSSLRAATTNSMNDSGRTNSTDCDCDCDCDCDDQLSDHTSEETQEAPEDGLVLLEPEQHDEDGFLEEEEFPSATFTEDNATHTITPITTSLVSAIKRVSFSSNLVETYLFVVPPKLEQPRRPKLVSERAEAVLDERGLLVVDDHYNNYQLKKFLKQHRAALLRQQQQNHPSTNITFASHDELEAVVQIKEYIAQTRKSQYKKRQKARIQRTSIQLSLALQATQGARARQDRRIQQYKLVAPSAVEHRRRRHIKAALAHQALKIWRNQRRAMLLLQICQAAVSRHERRASLDDNMYGNPASLASASGQQQQRRHHPIRHQMKRILGHQVALQAKMRMWKRGKHVVITTSPTPLIEYGHYQHKHKHQHKYHHDPLQLPLTSSHSDHESVTTLLSESDHDHDDNDDEDLDMNDFHVRRLEWAMISFLAAAKASTWRRHHRLQLPKVTVAPPQQQQPQQPSIATSQSRYVVKSVRRRSSKRHAKQQPSPALYLDNTNHPRPYSLAEI